MDDLDKVTEMQSAVSSGSGLSTAIPNIDDMAGNRILVCESRINPSLLASILVFYQKKGIVYKTRSDAINGILQSHLLFLKEAYPEDTRILSEEDALIYMDIQIGGRKGLTMQRSKRAAQLLLDRQRLITSVESQSAVTSINGLTADEIDKLITDATE